MATVSTNSAPPNRASPGGVATSALLSRSTLQPSHSCSFCLPSTSLRQRAAPRSGEPFTRDPWAPV
eukprot:8899376-Pyramimonas_sp.AAC.1